MITRAQNRARNASPVSSSRASSATMRARKLAAEAEHTARMRALELAAAELNAKQAVAEAEHRLKIAEIEAEESCSRRSYRSSHASVVEWLDASAPHVSSNTCPQVPDTTALYVPSQAPWAEGAAVPTLLSSRNAPADTAALPASALFAGPSRDAGLSLPVAEPPARTPACVGPPELTLHSTLGTQNTNYNKHNKVNNHTLQLAQAVAEIAAATALKSPKKVSFPLPLFDGRPSDFLIFRKVFRDKSSSFSCAENLVRLNAALRGPAKDCVAVLLAATQDPQDVLQALETAFAKPEHIILAQLSAVRTLPKLSAAENSRDLNTFACKVRNCVEVVRLLQRPEYLASPELSNEIVSKLTPILRSRWVDFAHSREHTNLFRLELLADFLMCEANLRTKYDVMTFDVKPVKCHASHVTVARANTIDKPKSLDDSVKKVCLFCSDTGHDVKSCKSFADLTVDERWEWVRNKKVCHKCLLRGGHTYISCKKFSCRVKDCNNKTRHHSLLHKISNETKEIAAHTDLTSEPQSPPMILKEPTAMTTNDGSSTLEEGKSAVIIHSTSSPKSFSTRTFLKVVAVSVMGPKGSYDTFALLDDGSTATLLDSKVALAVGVEGRKGDLCVHGIGGMTKQTEVSYVDIKVKGRHSSETYLLKNVRSIPNLGLASQSFKASDINSAAHLTDLAEILIYDEAEPTLLIGIDNWELTVPRELRKGSRNQPVAALTAFGWVMFGSIKNSSSPIQFINHCTVNSTESLDVQLKEYFRVDSIGIVAKSYLREDDKRATEILEKTTCRLPSGRFETGLLWRSDIKFVPDSYPLARKRFLSLEHKMNKDKSYADAYRANIEAMIKKGYAEPCINKLEGNIKWYLPHFAVVHPQKRKLRVVHDAAATYSGVSLNSMLLPGPDILQPLLAILMRFRVGRVALNADIREMFPQTKIRRADRDAQRFLWRNNPSEPLKTYRMSSMIFGTTSSPFTALYLKNLNAEEHRELYPAAANAIIQDHYMDDYLGSVDSPAEAARLAADIVHVHAQAGLDMRAWVSNSKEALSALPVDICTLDATAVSVRILGVTWNVTDDTLCFSRSNMGELPSKLTKRTVLSYLMRVYDPLGFLSPIVIRGRIIFQQTWKLGIGWDEEIPPSLISKWQSWFHDLSDLQLASIPRHYFGQNVILNCQLHIFADASELAYACVAYWRFTCVDETVQLVLIGSKARLAPLKPVSIPRLELQAALMAARFASYIVDAHNGKFSNVFYWSDSLTVLKWLRSDARSFKPFVAHRVGEIAELSNVSNWKYVPTALNVADDATRTDHKFKITSRWFSGPSFLTLQPTDWPVEPVNSTLTPEEMKRSASSPEVVALTNVTDSISPVIPDVSRFSTWHRLLRAAARVFWCARAFRSLLGRPQKTKLNNKSTREPEQTPSPSSLRSEDITLAERNLLLQSQLNSFRTERLCLRDAKPLPKQSRLHNLSLFRDDFGLLRLSGRVGAVESTGISKNPIVLDGKQDIVKLLISHHHRKAAHSNNELVVNNLRREFYILGLRPAVRKLAKSCLECRIRKSVPLTPPIGDLPPERLAHHMRPFSFVGLDYFGPVFVTVGRRTEKRWIALFTCLTIRAIHIEIVANLTSDSAIMALRRFIARRGCPSTLYSDNGTAFVGANKELATLYSHPVQDFVVDQRINWKFIPPAAPFMGGCWERMIRSVKNALKATLKERAPREEILHTLLLEVEGILNSRPLTHVSVDPDTNEAITPFHFILGTSSPHTPMTECTDADLIRRVQWKKAQRFADHFWTRWVREYLPSLVPRPEVGPTRNLKPGDIVLVADGNLPRGYWPRGRIVKVFPGHDGVVRVVDVEIRGGILRRPARKLIPLPQGE